GGGGTTERCSGMTRRGPREHSRCGARRRRQSGRLLRDICGTVGSFSTIGRRRCAFTQRANDRGTKRATFVLSYRPCWHSSSTCSEARSRFTRRISGATAVAKQISQRTSKKRRSVRLRGPPYGSAYHAPVNGLPWVRESKRR